MTSPDERQQKVCPFCGSESSLGTVRYSRSMVREQGWAQDTFHFVSCMSCGSNNKGLVGFDTPADAVEHWNRRAAPVAAPSDTPVAELQCPACKEFQREGIPFYWTCRNCLDRLCNPSDAVRALQDVAVMVNTIWDAIEDCLPAEAINGCDNLLKRIGPILAQVSQTNINDAGGTHKDMPTATLGGPASPNSDAQDAIFTTEQVANLWRCQMPTSDDYGAFRVMHPFTCANRGDGKHAPIGSDLGMLVPTVRGWICPFCDYTQDWAHDAMKATPPYAPKERSK